MIWRRRAVEIAEALLAAVLLAAFARTFLVQPFRIPSASMAPALVAGDQLLVNRFVFGPTRWRWETRLLPMRLPRRGDVVVFRYPLNPSQDFIKRVVGVPGDSVNYKDKRLTVNGVPWPQKPEGTYSYLEGLRFETMSQFAETVDTGHGSKVHVAAVDPAMPAVAPGQVRAFPGRENCDYNSDGSEFTCKVPAGNYFVMGDNRDRSDDGRYWGFVPDDHLRGRAFFIWFNWDDIAGLAFKRVGSGIR